MFDVIGDGVSGIFAVIHMVLFIWALMNIIGSNMSVGEKILWALVVLFLPLLGLILYLVLGQKA